MVKYLPIIAELPSMFKTTFKESERYRNMVVACKNNNLTPKLYELEEILQEPPEACDPIYLDAVTTPWFLKTVAALAPRRVIICSDISSEMLGYPGVSVVYGNTVKSQERSIRYLKEAGRVRVALFAPTQKGLRTFHQVQSFLDVAKRLELPFGEADIYWDTDTLEGCFARFLEHYKNYNAVYCTNVESATFFVAEAKENGIRVPEDLYVIGDGSKGRSMARYSFGGITRTELDEAKIGRDVVHTFVHLRRHRTLNAVYSLFDMDFVVGNTTEFFVDTEKPDACRLDLPVYRSEAVYRELAMMEDFLAHMEEVDKNIINAMQTGKTINEMEEMLYMSSRTISYRIQRMTRMIGAKNRADLLEKLKKYEINW